MMVRRLRITASVFFAMLVVAFAVLCVASYWRIIIMQGQLPGTNAIAIHSFQGSSRFYVWKGSCDWSLEFPTDPFELKMVNPIVTKRGKYTTRTTQLLPGLRAVQLPHHVSLIVACAVLAALPWFSRRFSLRTLLIVSTLAAVVLGLGVWLTR